jgi:hypothetical protein
MDIGIKATKPPKNSPDEAPPPIPASAPVGKLPTRLQKKLLGKRNDPKPNDSEKNLPAQPLSVTASSISAAVGGEMPTDQKQSPTANKVEEREEEKDEENLEDNVVVSNSNEVTQKEEEETGDNLVVSQTRVNRFAQQFQDHSGTCSDESDFWNDTKGEHMMSEDGDDPNQNSVDNDEPQPSLSWLRSPPPLPKSLPPSLSV